MKTLIRILIAIALTILILNQASAQTYQGSPVKFSGNRMYLYATINKDISLQEAKAFFNFLRKEVGVSLLKDRYLIANNATYFQPGMIVQKKYEVIVCKKRNLKRVITIKSKLPKLV